MYGRFNQPDAVLARQRAAQVDGVGEHPRARAIGTLRSSGRILADLLGDHADVEVAVAGVAEHRDGSPTSAAMRSTWPSISMIALRGTHTSSPILIVVGSP